MRAALEGITRWVEDRSRKEEKKCEQESVRVKLQKEKQRDGQRPYSYVCYVPCVWCCTTNIYNKVLQMGKL